MVPVVTWLSLKNAHIRDDPLPSQLGVLLSADYLMDKRYDKDMHVSLGPKNVNGIQNILN